MTTPRSAPSDKSQPSASDPLRPELPPGASLKQIRHYDNQTAFLQAYAHFGKLYKAAHETNTSINTVESWQHMDTHGFRSRLHHAHEVYVEYWESVMDSRLETPQGNRGSDILLMFKLKAERPEKYREEVKVMDAGASKELLDRLRALGQPRVPAPLPAPSSIIKEPSIEAQYQELPVTDTEAEGSDLSDAV